MARIAAFLPLLPGLARAIPIYDEGQHAITSDRSTQGNTKVFVYNDMPCDTALMITHRDGDNSDSQGSATWDYTDPGDVFGGEKLGYYPITYETTRKDYDKWQVGVWFRDPDWTFWTPDFTAILPLDAAGGSVGFTLGSSGITTPLLGAEATIPFSIPGFNFPKEAENINSFVFLTVRNSFKDTSTSLSVELLTRANEWYQEQTFIQEKGNSNATYLPFFFENNATKPYYDGWNFKLSRTGKRSLTTKNKRCELLPKDAGSFLVATVNETGWNIADYIYHGDGDVRCDGIWDARKNGEDGEDWFEGEL